MNYELYPEKAQYLTGEEVRLVVESSVRAQGADAEPVFAELKVYRLDRPVFRRSITPGGEPLSVWTVGKFDEGFAGFGAELWVTENGNSRLGAATAFDVVKSPELSTRYGFLSDFDTQDGENDADLDFMRRQHINMLQFYDWSWRHDKLVADDNIYFDMMGKRKDLGTIRKKIAAAHRFGMKALGYGAVYAASGEYFEAYPQQALYTSRGEPFRFIDIFYIMNIERGNPWHDHILEQYRESVSEVGFDGIHMDTYGFPKTGFSDREGKRKVELKKEFPALIEDAKTKLNQCKKDNYLIFNNVGNWPVGPVARTPQTAVYIEVWPPYERYHHIREIIAGARAACGGKKPVILAAYLTPFKLEDEAAKGGDYEETPGADPRESRPAPGSDTGAGFAALLLTAAITSMGAYHLLLGEEGAVLTCGYYPDYSVMRAPYAKRMRKYYDFLIRYLELFFAADMTEVSMTHMGGDNCEYRCSFSSSGDGEAGKVWVIARENGNGKCISLINLKACEEDCWNRAKPEPEICRDLELTVLTDGEVEGVFLASPDDESGVTPGLKPLPFTRAEDGRGKFLRFTVPVLYLWDVVYVKGKE